MKKNNRTRLSRLAWRTGTPPGVAPRLEDSVPLRQQLLQEIKDLEAQVAHAQGSSSADTRALVPSCQEMIRARRALYRQLER